METAAIDLINILGRRALSDDGLWSLEANLAHTLFPSRRLLSEAADLSTSEVILYSFLSVLLIILSATAAGLTLGLLSLDKLDLEIIKHSGSPEEAKLATRVEPLISNPHRLLVSLLLLNSICMEALPIFLDKLLNPVAAIALSVTAILIFGEIAPQAVCKRYGLQVGAYLSWFVRLVMILAYPIAWPIGKLLDKILGHESVLFRRNELRALVTLHGDDTNVKFHGSDSYLTTDEIQIIHGALDLAHKTAEYCMTPLDKVFSLSSDDVIDRPLLERIIAQGHSRIPVHRGTDKKDIVGLILVKELVLVDETAGFTVKQCSLRDLPRMKANLPLYSALKLFRSGHSHMAVLTRPLTFTSSDDNKSKSSPAVPTDNSITPTTTSSDKADSNTAGGKNTTTTSTLKQVEEGTEQEHDDNDSSKGGNTSGRGHALLNPHHSQEYTTTTTTTTNGGSDTNTTTTTTTTATTTTNGSNNHNDPSRPPIPRLHSKINMGQEEIVGVLTIEDVLEELLQYEIIDETDQYVDNMKTMHVRAKTAFDFRDRKLKFLTRQQLGGGGGVGGNKGGGGQGQVVEITHVKQASGGGTGITIVPQVEARSSSTDVNTTTTTATVVPPPSVSTTTPMVVAPLPPPPPPPQGLLAAGFTSLTRRRSGTMPTPVPPPQPTTATTTATSTTSATPPQTTDTTTTTSITTTPASTTMPPAITPSSSVPNIAGASPSKAELTTRPFKSMAASASATNLARPLP